MPVPEKPPRLITATQALRLDKLLCQELSLSRKEALQLLKDGAVKLHAKVLSEASKGLLLKPGEELTITTLRAVSGQIIPAPEQELEILLEQAGFVVVNKPAGTPVMPLRANETQTLLNAAVARYPELQGVGEGGLKSGVVHRLDTDTSGCLMLALNDHSWQQARRAFKQHESLKRYLALVYGQVTGQGQERAHLMMAQKHPAKARVMDKSNPKTRLCSLSWKSLETFDTASLLDISLETGFLHQIRVIFAHKGQPIIGDRLYGTAHSASLAPRQMLHAHTLELLGLKAYSPKPADFLAALERLR